MSGLPQAKIAKSTEGGGGGRPCGIRTNGTFPKKVIPEFSIQNDTLFRSSAVGVGFLNLRSLSVFHEIPDSDHPFVRGARGKNVSAAF